MPIISATQEAEVGGSLEPKSSRLHLATIIPPHSSPGDSMRPGLMEKKKMKRQTIECYGLSYIAGGNVK